MPQTAPETPVEKPTPGPKPALTPWTDRFNKPSIADLFQQYEGSPRSLADEALTTLESLATKSPKIEWKGPSWRWSITFRKPKQTEPWGYLVPTPVWPTVAMPVPDDIAQTILKPRTSKFLRETLMLASQVGPTRWAQWQVQSKAQLQDVLKLAATIANHAST